MDIKLFIYLLLILGVSCSNQRETIYEITDSKVEVNFGSKITEKELADIAKDCKEQKNILLDYSGTTFNSSGEITSLKISVDSQDGYSGKMTASPFQLRTKEHGFIRDYSENSPLPFKIGSI